MSYEIKLLELPDQPTLVMRSTMPVGMPFGAYYNLDMNALDVEAGFPVSRKIKGPGEIKTGVITVGKFISTIHVGAYDSVKPAYDALAQWAKDNGYEPTGVTYEYYLNDPSANPSIKPETEIRFPIK